MDRRNIKIESISELLNRCAEMSGMPIQNPSLEIQLMTVLHGTLIKAGVLDKDSAHSGIELIKIAQTYIDSE